MADTLWYAALDNKQAGPFGEAQFRDMIARGQITRDTLVWTAGITSWTKAGEVPGLMGGVPAPLPPAMPGSGDRILTTLRTWPLFGRMLLLMLGNLLVIPAPWVNTSFYRWLIAALVLPNRKPLGFTGKAGDIWYVFIIGALAGWIGTAHFGLQLLMIPVTAWVYVAVLRWGLANLVWEGQTTKLTFTGGYGGFIGWWLLFMLSFITIIGWAWVCTAMFRWLCEHIEGSRWQMGFVGSGWGVLWRSLLFVLGCMFIIPIPWLLRWYTRWYITQFTLTLKA